MKRRKTKRKTTGASKVRGKSWAQVRKLKGLSMKKKGQLFRKYGKKAKSSVKRKTRRKARNWPMKIAYGKKKYSRKQLARKIGPMKASRKFKKKKIQYHGGRTKFRRANPRGRGGRFVSRRGGVRQRGRFGSRRMFR